MKLLDHVIIPTFPFVTPQNLCLLPQFKTFTCECPSQCFSMTCCIQYYSNKSGVDCYTLYCTFTNYIETNLQFYCACYLEYYMSSRVLAYQL